MWVTNVKTWICIILLCIPSFLSAQHFATLDEIQTVAQNYAQHFLNQSNTDLEVTNIVTKSNESHILLYDVLFNNGYGVILSSVKSCIPVVCYYQLENGNSLFIDNDFLEDIPYFIEKYCYEISYAIDSLKDIPDNEEWNWLYDNLFFQSELADFQSNIDYLPYNRFSCDITPSGEVFGPYIITKWGQTSSNDGRDHNAYNYYVKETCKDCNGGKCPVGCVALAMAQIMKYWEYPEYANNSSNKYEWAKMPLELKESSENYKEERHQIAQLLIDCGKAADVNYCYSNTCESFAWPAKARDGLVDVFKYSPEADRKLRSSFTTKKWKEMLIQDLMNHQPIIYGAISFTTKNFNQGGHAFICDGYNSETGLFHFDWGRKGKLFNVWYNIDELICDKKNWNHLERAVFGIKPRK